MTALCPRCKSPLWAGHLCPKAPITEARFAWRDDAARDLILAALGPKDTKEPR